MPELQPQNLSDDLITLTPLVESDYEGLYSVASDPLLWAQHPSMDRYKPEVFEGFFREALNSKGAFLVKNADTGEVVGSSRFYDYNAEQSSILIGYTFIARKFWGSGYNKSLKTIMLDYAFAFVDSVILHIGSTNFRSQKAIDKLGGIKIGEVNIAYAGEPVKNVNFVYEITQKNWLKRNRK